MSVIARHTVGEYLYDFSCSQWSELDPAIIADWTVISDNCGVVTEFGVPYASGQFEFLIGDYIRGRDPVEVIISNGSVTVGLIDGTTDGNVLTWTAALGWHEAAPAGGTGTVTSVAATAPAAGFTVSGSPITTAGTLVFTLADDLAALEALASTGILARTAADTYALRTITASTGISIANGDGVSGNPTITNTAPDQVVVLSNGAGISVTGTYPNFTIASTLVGLTDGDKGDITVTASGATWTIDNNVVTLAKFQQIATDSFLGRDTAGTGNVEVLSVATVKTLLDLAGINSGDQTITLTGDVTGSGTGSFPATIAANAVTLNKMATVATARFLGRVTAGTGNVEAMTGTQATTLLDVFTSALKGLVPASGGGTTNYLRADGTFAAPPGSGVQQSGTLVNNRIAISAGANLIKDFSSFTVDGTNGRMTLTNITPGFGIGQGILNIPVPTGGTNEIIRSDGNVSGNLLVSIYNVNNINTAANTIVTLGTGGAGAGDPMVQFVISAVATWAAGVDNSDGDKFKVTPNSTPGGTANSGFIVTRDSPPRVGINRDSPTYTLDSNGVARATHYITTGNVWSAANHAFGVGAGTAPTLNGLTGGHNGFLYEFTTGTAPTNNGIIGTLTFPTGFPAGGGVRAVFSARGTTAATDIAKFYINTVSDTQLVFRANGTLTASTAYQFQFILMGYA